MQDRSLTVEKREKYNTKSDKRQNLYNKQKLILFFLMLENIYNKNKYRQSEKIKSKSVANIQKFQHPKVCNKTIQMKIRINV